MKRSKIIFFSLLLVGFSFLISYQYDKLEILTTGKEVVIKQGDFAVPYNCEYIGKDNSKFLNFRYNGKDKSIRIKNKQCLEIQKMKELKLLTNSTESIFVLPNSNLKFQLASMYLVFFVFSFCVYKLMFKSSS